MTVPTRYRPGSASIQGLTRGQFIRRAALAAGSASVLPALLAACGGDDDSGSGSGSANQTLTMATYGGTFGELLDQHIFNPFTAETGIPVTQAQVDFAALKLQVESGNVQWDLANVVGWSYGVGAKEGLYEPYDYDAIDTSNLPNGVEPKEYGTEYTQVLFVMAWRDDAVRGKGAPKTWADFWDTERYPGKRSLFDGITDQSLLEAALVADGVPEEDIYPLDLDRAFASIERLGRDRIVWASSLDQTIQHLVSGEADLATTANGRVTIAQRDNAPIGFTSNEAWVQTSYWVMPKGAANQEAAWKLLDFLFTDPEGPAGLMEATGYPVSNKAALELVPDDLVSTFPTSDKFSGRVFRKSDEWWADNLDEATAAFKEWQASF